MYSQIDEEKVILDYYKIIKSKNGLKFSNKILDIGANDGETLSNTRGLIIEYPEIVGYFVEPNPESFEKLQKLYYKNHNLYNFAISDVDGKLEMYCNGSHITDNDRGLLSTLIYSETERWQDEKWEKKIVDSKKYPFHDVNFDFISIDAEGMDEIILSQIDLSNTHILCIEWNSIEERKKNIDEYCQKFSMSILHQNSTNLIYKNES